MASAMPDLPEVADDDSMLSRKFGREVANYFSGSPLNRVSFLRADHVFLRSAFAHPASRFLLLDDLAALVQQGDAPRLAFVTGADVAPFTGEDPFAKTEEEIVRDYSSEESRPLVLFLGIDEKHRLAATVDHFEYKGYRGSPYFAVDVTPRGDLAERAKGVGEAVAAKGLSFSKEARPMGLPAGEGKGAPGLECPKPLCGGCGQPTLSVNAGTKRTCPPTDSAGGAVQQRRPCPTRQGISNLSFPRTDPTVIMACVSADGGRMLLGRQKRWPPNWYSTLAGFLEPGESIEEAVRREVWEESGVRLGRVVIHSSQPWPFPANLMIGAIAQAAPGDGETIRLDHDKELDDARWFPVDEVRAALHAGTGGLGDPAPPGYKEGSLRIPPRTAIANQLMAAVVNGYLGAAPKM